MNSKTCRAIVRLAITLLLAVAPGFAQNAAAASGSHELDVAATNQWLDTKLDLRSGEKVRFTVSGTARYPQGVEFGPDGQPRGWKDLLHQFPVPDGGHGALIGRLGTGNGAQPFLIGASKEFEAPVPGRLFLGLNESAADAAGATGSFHVKVEILEPGGNSAEGAAGGPAEAPIPAITPALLDNLPRRVSDPQGNPGDMVNILIVGSEEQLVKAFETAGWVKTDANVSSAVAAAVLESLQKKDYLTMPMSVLYLYGRGQDYGFAHAEPVKVAMSRNHLRVWKSPQTLDGRPLWCIAATHDIGFERDKRTRNGITHKIDPAIDGEREYVNDTLSGTGFVAQRTHVTPSHPLTEANTATGGSFHSDGRVLVLVLK